MNNRINNLVKQAWQDANKDLEVNDPARYHSDRGPNLDAVNRKFAELILKDIDKIVDDLYHAMPIEQAVVLLTLDENIKEHFYGVEE